MREVLATPSRTPGSSIPAVYALLSIEKNRKSSDTEAGAVHVIRPDLLVRFW